MLVEADHALVLVVVPKNIESLPMQEVYRTHEKEDWVFAIVEVSCSGRFKELFGDLPWDQVWYIDLRDEHALEKALAEVRAKAEKRKVPVLRRLPTPPAPRPSTPWKPSPDVTSKYRVTSKWKRTSVKAHWSDDAVTSIRKKILRMARH